MKSRNEAIKWMFFLITAFILGGSSSGCDSQNNPEGGATSPVVTSPSPTPPAPTPAVDPLVVAQTSFKNKVWPFFQSDRCANCHDFANRSTGSSPYINITPLTHPLPTGNSATCMGCHSQATTGFPGWVEAPNDTRFSDGDDPNGVRTQVIAKKGSLLYNHLIGEGADADPFVQWAFFNAPNAAPASPAPKVNPGKVPAGGSHAGQIPNAELMDWNKFKVAVQEWICLESKIPGSPDLGKPASLDCSMF